ncbi:uncharacterized protein EI90DRAFT_2908235 [Cantharellus anzutake]|uniref:uncharacterized protein n=1 Tax=Cantharellus anzutake TaxID=1750568 RepID=UPI0019075DA6|nr:uncharacterized protein EI90DRAFT_2908235 [Cantharellus anzutake]KAF8338861.1 hypothetical protein EI90DRAFT_2908235 [Cantharellus anzutake]
MCNLHSYLPARQHTAFGQVIDSYCQDAHKSLAKINYAPTLHHCGPVGAGIIMVIMDLLEGHNALSMYTERPLPPPPLIEDVRNAIQALHQKDIVFGDSKGPNIMICQDKTDQAKVCAMLVDFDWAGKHGEACYPTTLNDCWDIVWAPGIVRGGIMRMEHDNFMLEQLSLSV